MSMRASKMKLIRRLLSISALVCSIITLLSSYPLSIQAQDKQSPDRGFMPSGSYAIGDIETINTTNGNLMMRIPLGGLPAGRGGLSAGLTMIYNSKLYDKNDVYEQCPRNYDQGQTPPNPECYGDLSRKSTYVNPSPVGGWRYGYQYTLELDERNYYPANPYHPYYNPCTDYHAIYRYILKMTMPDGSSHAFRLYGQTDGNEDGYFAYRPDGKPLGLCPTITPLTGKLTYYSTDGTYMRLEFEHDSDDNWANNPWTLSLPNGTRVTGGNAPQRIYDRNENFIEIQETTYNNHPATKLIDQLGRYLIVEKDTANKHDLIHQWGTGNVETITKIKWKTIQITKTYLTGYHGPLKIFPSFDVIDYIELPEQAGSLRYTFGYNAPTVTAPIWGGAATASQGWGELNSIVLPSGAQTAYQYKLDGVDGTSQAKDVLNDHPTRKDLTYQQEYDGASTPATETWLFSIPREEEGGTSVITSPDGGITRETFYPRQENPLAIDPLAGAVYKSESPDGTVVERIWANNRPFGTIDRQIGNIYVRTEFTSIRNAAGNLVKTAIKDYQYDKNGNLIRVREYDWVDYASVPRDGTTGHPTGIPQNAPLKRLSATTYYSSTPEATDMTTDDGDAYVKPSAPRLRNAVESTEAGPSETVRLARTEFFYDNATTTGNLIEQRSWDSSKGAYSNPLATGQTGNSISIANQYDARGNVTLTTDARGVQTKFTYASINGHADLYPTMTEAAYGTSIKRTSTHEYDYYTGRLTRTTDADNNVSTRTDYDIFGRPVLAVAAEGKPEEARTSTDYSDTLRRVIVRSDLNTVGDGKLVSVQHYDQLGRVRLTRQLEDAATQSATDETTGIKVQTRYTISGTNSYQIASNPYRAPYSSGATSETTMGWTRSRLDNSGRLVDIQTFSGTSLPAPWGSNTSSTGTVTTSYDGIYTTVTDQAGKMRRSMVDGLGHLLRVDEPDASNNLGAVESPAQATSYSYDALGNLTTVTQGAQTRTFSYSSLSRLTSATNPESGTLSYQYDAGGNLLTRTDARGIVSTYLYDALNRVTSRLYSDSTPAVTYTYDTLVNGKGRLTSASSTVSSTSYTQYDSLGRIRAGSQTTNNQTYQMSYTYDVAGNLKTQTYPSGRVVESEYDSAGRIAGVKKPDGVYYAGASATDGTNRIQYSAHGGAQAVRLGNGLWEHTNFNSRLQPTQIGLGSSSTTSGVLQLDYSYGTSLNNGNVQSQTITAPGMVLTQNYTYDHLNRLKSFQETGGLGQQWNQVYLYDRYGNRNIDTSQTSNDVVFRGENPTFDQSNNRIAANQGYLYDVTGNLTQRPGLSGHLNTYLYDAENRMVSYKEDAVEVARYSYDGDGKRVKKWVNGETTIFVYNIQGQLIAEYTNSNQAGVGGTSYLTSDHLGSTRVVTNSTGVVKDRHDYLPFGEEIGSYVSGRSGVGQQDYKIGDTRQKFTQYERDNESGLDYAQARYYSSTQGRFTSADPLLSSAYPVDPQTWNRYTYCLNNPLSYIDPSGLDPKKWLTDGSQYFSVTQEEYDYLINQVDEAGFPIYTPVAAGTNIGVLHFVSGSSEFVDANQPLVGYEVKLGTDGNFELVDPSIYGGQLAHEMSRWTPALERSMEVIFIVDVIVIAAPIAAVEAAGGGLTTLGLPGGARVVQQAASSGLKTVVNQMVREINKSGATTMGQRALAINKLLYEKALRADLIKVTKDVVIFAGRKTGQVVTITKEGMITITDKAGKILAQIK